ncbi:MAG: ABC transporter substrate-binding protein [Chloroflexota bacterium]|nr:ABC transporter substrate-binding protein [Chloroflexota bacterium]
MSKQSLVLLSLLLLVFPLLAACGAQPAPPAEGGAAGGEQTPIVSGATDAQATEPTGDTVELTQAPAGATGDQPQAGGSFRYGRGGDSVALDPVNVTDGESLKVTRQIFDSLLAYKPGTTELVPALAVEVPEPTNGGRTYTFKLREGVKFHDGTDFNAEAVVFNFDRWRDSKNPYHKGGGGNSENFAYYTAQFGGFDNDSIITKVEATGPYEVQFTLKRPQAPFLSNIAMGAFGIASPAAVQKNVEQFWQNPVGTGPFKLVRWNQGSTVELEKYADWWGANLPTEEGGSGPYLDQVTFQSIPDNTGRTAALVGGQLSAADGLTPDDVPTIKAKPNLQVLERPAMNVGYLAMNNQKKPFDNPKVRQAVVHAINMPQIVQAFFGDTADVASNPMPPSIPYFNKSIQPYKYDPELSKRLLSEGGMPDGFTTDLWYMPVPRPYMPNGKGLAEAMQSDLAKVGIKVTLVTREWGTYLQEVGSSKHSMALLGWTGDNGDPDNFLNVLLSSHTATPEDANNIAYYKNPEVDKLLQTGQSTTDAAERRQAYYRAQEIIHEDVPWVPIAYARPPTGAMKTVQGYTLSPTGGEPFNSVYFSEGGR